LYILEITPHLKMGLGRLGQCKNKSQGDYYHGGDRQ
jgi:hypothetical protein